MVNGSMEQVIQQAKKQNKCSATFQDVEHQTPENREEAITELAFFWNKRKISGLAKELSRRYMKNENELTKAMDNIKETMKRTGLRSIESNIEKWKGEIQAIASGTECLSSKVHALQCTKNTPVIQ